MLTICRIAHSMTTWLLHTILVDVVNSLPGYGTDIMRYVSRNTIVVCDLGQFLLGQEGGCGCWVLMQKKWGRRSLNLGCCINSCQQYAVRYCAIMAFMCTLLPFNAPDCNCSSLLDEALPVIQQAQLPCKNISLISPTGRISIRQIP